MGLFSKKCYGTISSTDGVGHAFTWRLGEFSLLGRKDRIDSHTVVAFTGVKFYLHLAIDEKGNIGMYIRYKSTNIPKYSYYFSNSQGEVMRQHTAHTIPEDTERCGHWNATHWSDVMQFIDCDDVFFVNFFFDDDTLELHHPKPGNTLQVTWTVPDVLTRVLNPFSSPSFNCGGVERLVLRIDVRKKTGAVDAAAVYELDAITEFVVFVFSLKDRIPPHGIELLGAGGETIARLRRKDGGGAQTLAVRRERLQAALADGGALRVRVELETAGNPLEALNALSAAHSAAMT